MRPSALSRRPRPRQERSAELPMLKRVGGGPAIWFVTRGDRSSSPVVLLHGFTGTHRTWDLLVERLSKTHFVILPDLPGHGKSGVSRPSEMCVGLTSDAIAEVVRLANHGGHGRKAALIGYSLGGRIALDMACKHQELLSCLVLEGTSPGVASPSERAERKASDEALADEIERRGIEWFVDYWQETPTFSTQNGPATGGLPGDRARPPLELRSWFGDEPPASRVRGDGPSLELYGAPQDTSAPCRREGRLEVLANRRRDAEEDPGKRPRGGPRRRALRPRGKAGRVRRPGGPLP